MDMVTDQLRMDAHRWYWLIRAVFGIGVWIGVFGSYIVLHPEALRGSIELTAVTLVTVIVGAAVGWFWAGFIAAGLAGYIVYGNVGDGIPHPPIYGATPRHIFE